MNKIALTLVLLALASPAAARALPAGFVYLRDIEASIAQDIRYAGSDNFTGRPLPGYRAGECVLRRDVALALKRVQASLTKQGLGLKVYDCYRPARAVRAMWRWSQDGARDGNKRFYPRVPKRELFTLGYIASHSAHSTGTAVDLTLVAIGSNSSSAHSRASGNPEPQTRTTEQSPPRAAPCTAPSNQRERDTSIDMGTGFDCLDTLSRSANATITPEQKRARGLLNAAMRAQGFHNYFREWWHFSYGAHPAREYDFPIAPR